MSPPGPGGYGTPEQPAKKTSPWIFVGVGCATLFVVLAGGAIGLFLYVRGELQRGRSVSAGGAFSAGVAVSIDGGAVSFDAGATTGPPKGALGP